MFFSLLFYKIGFYFQSSVDCGYLQLYSRFKHGLFLSRFLFIKPRRFSCFALRFHHGFQHAFRLLSLCCFDRWSFLPATTFSVIIIYLRLSIRFYFSCYIFPNRFRHEYFVFVICTINLFWLLSCYPCLYYNFSYHRVTGLIITHQRAALFTARHQEMIEVLERSFFYLITHPEVHSPHSEIPFQVGWYFLYINRSLHLVDVVCQRVRSQGTENRDWDMFDCADIVAIPIMWLSLWPFIFIFCDWVSHV